MKSQEYKQGGGKFPASPRKTSKFINNIKRDWQLMVICLPAVLLLAIFSYVPMTGVLYGFQKAGVRGSFLTNEWVGLKNIEEFVTSYYFVRLVRNTLVLSFLGLVGGMLANILLALLFNEVRDGKFKRITQSLTFFPNFLSVTVVVAIMMYMFAPGQGILNTTLMTWLGRENDNVFTISSYFRPLYILSGIWQGAGWGSVIYLGSINNIDPELYDAAAIDGAGRLARIRHITLPNIKDVTLTLLILSIGSVMSVGSEKILLMYSGSTLDVADVISTYVYRVGLQGGDYGLSTAVGLFNSVVNLMLLLFANWASKKLTDVGIF